MLNRLSTGQRPVANSIKKLQAAVVGSLDSNSNAIGAFAGSKLHLNSCFSAGNPKPKKKQHGAQDSAQPGAEQQSLFRSGNRQGTKTVTIKFTPISEPKTRVVFQVDHAAKSTETSTFVRKTPADINSSQNWVEAYDSEDSLESAMSRCQSISELLDVLAKNLQLFKDQQILLLLFIQKLSGKCSALLSRERVIPDKLTQPQVAGLDWLLKTLPELVSQNKTSATILSATRLLSSLYLATEYSGSILHQTTKEVFALVTTLVKDGMFDNDPELLLMLVKEYARIHFSPRTVIDKIAKYIAKNDVNFLCNSLSKYPVLSFFSGAELMWRQRKHPVSDASSLFLDNKLADITNILCMVLAQHPSNKEPHFLNSTPQLERLNLPALSLMEAVRVLGVVAKLQTVWGTRQVSICSHRHLG